MEHGHYWMGVLFIGIDDAAMFALGVSVVSAVGTTILNIVLLGRRRRSHQMRVTLADGTDIRLDSSMAPAEIAAKRKVISDSLDALAS